MARWIWNVLNNGDAQADAITSDFGSPGGTTIALTARDAIENRLGSSVDFLYKRQ
jgi:hypothetical protein